MHGQLSVSLAAFTVELYFSPFQSILPSASPLVCHVTSCLHQGNAHKMHPIIFAILQYIPSVWLFRFNAIRVQFLSRWYRYFPTSTHKHLCLVCKETLRSKSGGSAADGFIQDSEDSGQLQFETIGQVTCPHHTSVQSLRDSADEDCMICSRVWSSFAGDPDQRQQLLEGLDKGDDILTYCYIAQSTHVGGDLGEKGGKNCLVVSVGVPERVLTNAPEPATFILLPSTLLHNSTFLPCLPSYSTSSFQSWVLASTWYQSCLTSHESCNRKRREQSDFKQWYPTRLIKISRWSNRLRLITARDEQPDGPYLTLSHCWGKSNFIQLTQSTKSDFLKDIPYSKLPKTFQDAISAARFLGVYYIWIDSLCIIQGEESLADWKHEAAKMDKVYSHSMLNISATGASDGSKGLFFPRSADATELLEIELDHPIRLKFSQKYTLLDYDYWKRLVLDEPLIRRAWVVQERLLAPRVLHFGSKQVFWECQLDASEDFPLGLPAVLARKDQQSLFKRRDEPITPLMELTHPSPAHAVWQRALSSYTHASLTKSEDKLIALAGIACELSPDISDGYIAGLWKDHIATELLWYVDLDTVSSRQKQYRAPSFSWASVDGGIVPGEWQKDDVLIEVQEAVTATETSNPFGSVESGLLRVRGTLKRAFLSPNYSRGKIARRARERIENRGMQVGTVHRPSMIELQRWIISLYNVFAPSNVVPEWRIICRSIFYDTPSAPKMVESVFPMWGAEVYLDQDLFPDYQGFEIDGYGPAKEVYCMLVTGQSLTCNSVRGLILEPTGQAEGEYRRLGVFMTNHWHSMNVLSVPHRSENEVPCKEYDADTHEHTIVIV